MMRHHFLIRHLAALNSFANSQPLPLLGFTCCFDKVEQEYLGVPFEVLDLGPNLVIGGQQYIGVRAGLSVRAGQIEVNL